MLPDSPRSWISKAHIHGALIRPRYYEPTTNREAGSEAPNGDRASNTWILINGTPAACVQMGLFHVFPGRGPVDLIIGGPNYGRNITSTSSLCSGTIGVALEAALCKKKAVALSFDKTASQDPDTIVACSKVSMRLIERLYSSWNACVGLYNINLPPMKDNRTPRVYWTTVLQNSCTSASIYREVKESDSTSQDDIGGLSSFEWAPQRQEQLRYIEESQEPTDAWALKMGYIRYAVCP